LLDEHFGENYAKKNPKLVASLVETTYKTYQFNRSIIN